MPVAKDPNVVAQKWATNLGNSVASIRASVQSMSQSPTAAAAAAVGQWQASVATQKAADKYVKGLNRVTLADWQAAMNNKAIPRIGPGAQAAIPKMTKFLTAFLPFEANIANQVRQMPKTTLQDRIARAAAQIQGNASFPGY